MKRALIVIASVGILAVTVAMESANAQVTRPYTATPQPGSQGAGWNGLNGLRHGWNGLNGLREGHGWNGLNAPRTLTTPDGQAATGWGSIGNNQFWKWKWE
jgi:hypothetical protein